MDKFAQADYVRSVSQNRGRPSRTRALYRDIADQLRQRIVSGAWPHGRPAPSMLAIARELNVGRRVIRLAYEALAKERLLLSTPRHQYQVNARVGGPTLASGVILQVVGKNLQHFLGEDTQEIQAGLMTGLAELRLPFLVLHDDALADGIPEDIPNLPTRGILLAGYFQPKVLAQYEKLSVPCVRVDAPPSMPGLNSVCFDNEGATRQAVERLAALGHKHMAFVQFALSRFSRIDPDSEERARAFRAALKDLRLPVHERSIVTTFSLSNPTSIEIRNLFSAKPRVTAVLAADPGRAMLVWKAAQNAGVQVPKDLSIASFRGLRPGKKVQMEFSGPAINFYELGLRAADLVKEAPKPARTIRIPAQWVDRTTLAACNA